jgi:hypothetical protein
MIIHSVAYWLVLILLLYEIFLASLWYPKKSTKYNTMHSKSRDSPSPCRIIIQWTASSKALFTMDGVCFRRESYTCVRAHTSARHSLSQITSQRHCSDKSAKAMTNSTASSCRGIWGFSKTCMNFNSHALGMKVTIVIAWVCQAVELLQILYQVDSTCSREQQMTYGRCWHHFPHSRRRQSSPKLLQYCIDVCCSCNHAANWLVLIISDPNEHFYVALFACSGWNNVFCARLCIGATATLALLSSFLDKDPKFFNLHRHCFSQKWIE